MSEQEVTYRGVKFKWSDEPRALQSVTEPIRTKVRLLKEKYPNRSYAELFKEATRDERTRRRD